MALIPKRQNDWSINPFSELETLQKEMNRLFDFSLSRHPQLESSFLGGQWVPSLDVYDKKDAVVVKSDLPGMTKDEIDVSIENDILTIKGEKKREEDTKDENYIRSERFYGTFQRSIALPASVDASKAKASFKDGVLELVLPKKEEAKPKQIKIELK